MSAPTNAAPSAAEVAVLAKVAGIPVTPEVAARIAGSIGPAFTGFSAIAGTLPLDLEPATFTVVQNEANR
ncbi:MAG: hypothetical protein AB1586_25950 [Pseudomonadota bacterium]|jgi:hypothetical protein